MSQIELIYQKHLDDLRELAREEGVSFAEILRRVNKSFKPGLSSYASKSAGKEEIDRVEKTLIDEYRPQFYEGMANESLEVKQAFINAIKADLEPYREKHWKNKQARKTADAQKQNLALGRPLGTAKTKQRANAIHGLAHQIDKDLLAHPDTARWTLAQRAAYIQEKLATATVEVDGHTYKATMANGRNYAMATIRTWITGT